MNGVVRLISRKKYHVTRTRPRRCGTVIETCYFIAPTGSLETAVIERLCKTTWYVSIT